LGVSNTQYIYVQNLTDVSTQASVFYQGPETEQAAAAAATAKATNQAAGTASAEVAHVPSFTVIPSLLYLRPRETKRLSVIYYPRTIQPIPSTSRLCILGLGEERYTLL